DRAPIATAFLYCIGQIRAVYRRRPFRQSGSAVCRPFVRIDDNTIQAIHAFTNEEHRLALKSSVARKEIPRTPLFWRSKALVVEKGTETLSKCVSPWKPVQIRGR